MARYSRRRGPAANFELTATLTTIPGFSVMRSFGTGTLLVCGHIRITNNSVGVIFAGTRVLVDGVFMPGHLPGMSITNGENGLLAFSNLIAVSQGIHTIELQAVGDVAAGDFVTADSTEFIVIEFPEWDQDDDLVTL